MAEKILIRALEYVVRLGPSDEGKDRWGDPITKGFVIVRTYPAEEKKVYGHQQRGRTEYATLPSFRVTYHEKDCSDCGGKKGCFKITGGWPGDDDRHWDACTIAQVVQFFITDGAGNLRSKKQTVGLISMKGFGGQLYADLPGFPQHNALEKGHLLLTWDSGSTGELPKGF